MSIYQKLVALQDEAERLTGVRPRIQLQFHAYDKQYSDDESQAIRDRIAESSGGALKPHDTPLEYKKEKWIAYDAEDDRNIVITVHGPAVHYAVS